LIQFFVAKNSSIAPTPSWISKKGNVDQVKAAPSSISKKGNEADGESGKATPRWIS